MSSSFVAEAEDEVDDDGHVEEHDGDLDGRDVFDDFVDLERDECAGADDGEVFGPAFAEQEAGAFGEKDGGIEEGADAELFELFWIDVEGACHYGVHIVVFGIYAQNFDPVFDGLGEVVMKEAQCAESDDEKRETLEEFEEADEQQGV